MRVLVRCFDRPEQCAVFVAVVAGRVEVLDDQCVGPGMQRQIPRLLALAVDLEMRDAAERVPEILNLDLRAAVHEKARSTGWRDRASP